MRTIKGAVLGFAVGFAVAVFAGCGPTKTTCDSTSCSGCCDSAGQCQGGTQATACGSAGISCTACITGQSCIGGVCIGGTGGGGGGGVGGGAGGGMGGGAGGGLGGGGGTTLASLDDFCAVAVPAVCQYYVRCGYFSDQQRCEALYGQYLSGPNCAHDEKAAVKDGRATFDGVRIQRCLDKLRTTAACIIYGAPDPDCDPLVDGLVAAGQPCYADFECAGVSRCTSDSLTCPGQCQTLVPIGGTVATGDQCVPEAYPSGGVCVANLPLNGDCSTGLPCAEPNSCVNGVCTAPAQRGQPCTSPDLCAGAMACTNGVCGDFASAGQSCHYGSPSIPCKADLFCGGADGGVCIVPSGVGGPCGTLSNVCSPALRCAIADGGAGTCATKLAQGTSCTTSSDCAQGLFCDTAGTGHCETQRPGGASCSQGDECAGYCDMFSGDGGVCVNFSCQDPTP